MTSIALPALDPSTPPLLPKDMSNSLQIHTGEDKGWRILTLSGRLDALSCDTAQDAMLAEITRESPKLAIEASGIAYISSAGIRALLLAARTAGRQPGGAFAVLSPSPIVGKVLAECGLDACLGVCQQLP